MAQVILPGDPPIEIMVLRSARSRRINLRVSRLDGRVTLSLPAWTPQAEAVQFAREKEAWIRANLPARDVQVPRIGGTVLYEGALLPIVAGAGAVARLQGGALHVAPGNMVAARVAAFLKLRARMRLVAASDHHARALGVGYARLSLRDTRSRWGSCTSAGHLMYSWRLIMAPPAVLDYVAAHEVAHLVEMNHSAAFWAVVARLCPEYAGPRAWLRANGAALHHYRFED